MSDAQNNLPQHRDRETTGEHTTVSERASDLINHTLRFTTMCLTLVLLAVSVALVASAVNGVRLNTRITQLNYENRCRVPASIEYDRQVGELLADLSELVVLANSEMDTGEILETINDDVVTLRQALRNRIDALQECAQR